MTRRSTNYNHDTGLRRRLTRRRTKTNSRWMSISAGKNSILHALHVMAAMLAESYVTYTVLLAILLAVQSMANMPVPASMLSLKLS